MLISCFTLNLKPWKFNSKNKRNIGINLKGNNIKKAKKMDLTSFTKRGR
jgi:hypothetical protein